MKSKRGRQHRWVCLFQSGYALHVLILWFNQWGQRCYKETAVEDFS